MRRVLLAIAVVVGALATESAAVAEPRPAAITVVGDRTSVVDVRFDEAFRLDDQETKVEFQGGFGGWMIHPAGGPLDYGDGDFAGAYVIGEVGPRDPEDGPTLFTITLEDRTFPPGRYRLYLLADGPTTIRIPMLEGGRSRTIRPVAPADARWTAEDLALTGPGVANGSVSQPLRVTGNSLTFTTLYLHSNEGATVQEVFACLRDTPEEATYPEQSCEGGGFVGSVIHPQQDYVFTLNSIYPPGTVPSGNYYAFSKARAAAVDRVSGVGLTIDLGGA